MHPVFVLKANILYQSSGEPLTVEPYQSSLQHAEHTHSGSVSEASNYSFLMFLFSLAGFAQLKRKAV